MPTGTLSDEQAAWLREHSVTARDYGTVINHAQYCQFPMAFYRGQPDVYCDSMARNYNRQGPGNIYYLCAMHLEMMGDATGGRLDKGKRGRVFGYIATKNRTSRNKKVLRYSRTEMVTELATDRTQCVASLDKTGKLVVTYRRDNEDWKTVTLEPEGELPVKESSTSDQRRSMLWDYARPVKVWRELRFTVAAEIYDLPYRAELPDGYIVIDVPMQAPRSRRLSLYTDQGHLLHEQVWSVRRIRDMVSDQFQVTEEYMDALSSSSRTPGRSSATV